MTRVDKALAYLLELIGQGREFPDAAREAARKFRLSYEGLRDAYDDHCEKTENQPPAESVGKNPNFPTTKPCAHCGAMPCPPGKYVNGNWGIRCSWCCAMTSDRDLDKSIADWNRRPLTAALEVARLRELFRIDGEQHAAYVKEVRHEQDARLDVYKAEVARLLAEVARLKASLLVFMTAFRTGLDPSQAQEDEASAALEGK